MQYHSLYWNIKVFFSKPAGKQIALFGSPLIISGYRISGETMVPDREVTEKEAKQEWRRLAGVADPGRVLIYNNPTLADAAPKGFFVSQIHDISDLGSRNDFELIHLSFPEIALERWPDVFKKAHQSLSDTGTLRILAYADESRTVQAFDQKPTPVLKREQLIGLLDQAGFSGISIDRRWFWRAAYLYAKSAKGAGAFIGVIPAWYEAVTGQGAILAAYAWK